MKLTSVSAGPKPNLELNLWDFGRQKDDYFLGLTLAINPSPPSLGMYFIFFIIPVTCRAICFPFSFSWYLLQPWNINSQQSHVFAVMHICLWLNLLQKLHLHVCLRVSFLTKIAVWLMLILDLIITGAFFPVVSHKWCLHHHTPLKEKSTKNISQ